MLEFLVVNWALISIAVTIVLLIVVPWMVLCKYIRIALNIVRDTVPPLSMGPRDFVRIEGESVEFRALDGLRLQGMFLYGKPEKRPAGMLIFAHEFKSDMHSAARYCQGVLDAGYDVFSFDFRNHGGSTVEEGYNPLQWCTDRELSDILGAVAYVEDWLEQEGRPPQIGMFGISRGGAACLLAARTSPIVKAILTDGAFSSDKVIEHFMKRWAGIFAKARFVYSNNPPWFWRFLRWLLFRECKHKLGIRMPSARKALLTMTPRPLFIIHGERDGYIPVDQARMLYVAAAEPKFMWIVPGAKHNQSAIITPHEYARRTAWFFDRFLAGKSDSPDWPGEPERPSVLQRPALRPDVQDHPARSSRPSRANAEAHHTR